MEEVKSIVAEVVWELALLFSVRILEVIARESNKVIITTFIFEKKYLEHLFD